MKKKAFTIIEILIVVVILGILTYNIIIPCFTPTPEALKGMMTSEFQKCDMVQYEMEYRRDTGRVQQHFVLLSEGKKKSEYRFPDRFIEPDFLETKGFVRQDKGGREWQVWAMPKAEQQPVGTDQAM